METGRPHGSGNWLVRFPMLIFALCFTLGIVGCLFSGFPGDSARWLPPDMNTGTARIELKIVIPEKGPGISTRLVPAIRMDGGTSAVVKIQLSLLFSNAEGRVTTLRKETKVTDGAASFSFDTIPALPIIAELAIENGSIGGKTEFHGVADLIPGNNLVELSPKGCGHPSDIMARAMGAASSQGLIPEIPFRPFLANDFLCALRSVPRPYSRFSHLETLNAFLGNMIPQGFSYGKLEIASDGEKIRVDSNLTASTSILQNTSIGQHPGLRFERILKQGAGGWGLVGFSASGSAYGIARVETSSLNVQAFLVRSGRRLDQIDFIPGGALRIGDCSLKGGGDPRIFQWSGNVSSDPQGNAGAGDLAALADSFEGWGSGPTVISFLGSGTVVLLDPVTGEERLYHLNPTGTEASGMASAGFKIWGILTGGGSLRLAWETASDSWEYRVRIASGFPDLDDVGPISWPAPPFVATFPPGITIVARVDRVDLLGRVLGKSVPLSLKPASGAWDLAPFVSIRADTSLPVAGQEVHLQGSVTDPDGDACSFDWSVSRGSVSLANASEAVWRCPSEAGPATVTLNVRDSRGACASSSLSLPIKLFSDGKWEVKNETGPEPLEIYFVFPDDDWRKRVQLYKHDCHMNAVPSRELGAWGSAINVAPCFRLASGTFSGYMAIGNLSCHIATPDLVIRYSAATTASILTASGEIRLHPPSLSGLEGEVSLEISGNPELGTDAGIASTSFEAVKVTTHWIGENDFDFSGVRVGESLFPAKFGWIIPTETFVLTSKASIEGGFNQWKPNAPTVEITILDNLLLRATARAEVSVDSNDDNGSFALSSDRIIRSYRYRFRLSEAPPPPQLASFEVSPAGQTVVCRWEEVVWAPGYEVVYSKGTVLAEDARTTTPTTETSVTIGGLEWGESYTFAVVACYANGKTARSGPKTVRISDGDF